VSTMSWRNGTVVGVIALAWNTTAFAHTHEVHREQLKSKSDATAPPPIRPDIKKPATLPSLGITKIRLDPPEPGEQENSAVLKFQMSNESSSTLTDIVFEVSIVEDAQRGQLDTPRRLLAGPFAIRGKIVLDPGYTADCDILLRNISPMCRCAANVRVLSFRSIGDSGP
jgi:hypothetical protein